VELQLILNLVDKTYTRGLTDSVGVLIPRFENTNV
jgi:hypothetical protein